MPTGSVPSTVALLVVVGIAEHVGRSSGLTVPLETWVLRRARGEVNHRTRSERDVASIGGGGGGGMLFSSRPWRLESCFSKSCYLLCCLPFLARCGHVSILWRWLLRRLRAVRAVIVLLLEFSFVL